MKLSRQAKRGETDMRFERGAFRVGNAVGSFQRLVRWVKTGLRKTLVGSRVL